MKQFITKAREGEATNWGIAEGTTGCPLDGGEEQPEALVGPSVGF